MPFSLRTWFSEMLGRPGRTPASAAPSSKGLRSPSAKAEPFHAVSIKPGPQCCEAARQLAGMRFLSTKVPKLPLPGCGEAACHCRYSHYSDRREGDDRRDQLSWRWRLQEAVNRRRGISGRRDKDSIG